MSKYAVRCGVRTCVHCKGGVCTFFKGSYPDVINWDEKDCIGYINKKEGGE